MSAQSDLTEFADRRPLLEPDSGELQRLYDDYNENVTRVAEEFELSRSQIRDRLIEHGIHDIEDDGSTALRHKYPHQVDGLSPLNCGDCGALEIYEHPCPECGFDPGGDGHE